MHFFAIHTTPTAAATNAEDIAAAIAHVWVNDTDQISAEQRARTYLMDQGWIAGEVDAVLAPTPAQIAQLDADELANYQVAVRYGIYAQFVAWPKEPRPEDSPVELRTLPKPPSSKSNN